jgi:hypothetical protein
VGELDDSETFKWQAAESHDRVAETCGRLKQALSMPDESSARGS